MRSHTFCSNPFQSDLSRPASAGFPLDLYEPLYATQTPNRYIGPAFQRKQRIAQFWCLLGAWSVEFVVPIVSFSGLNLKPL